MSHLKIIARLSTGLVLLAVAGCAPAAVQNAPAPVAAAPEAAPAGANLAQFFENYDAAQLSLSPEAKARRGIRDGDYG